MSLNLSASVTAGTVTVLGTRASGQSVVAVNGQAPADIQFLGCGTYSDAPTIPSAAQPGDTLLMAVEATAVSMLPPDWHAIDAAAIMRDNLYNPPSRNTYSCTVLAWRRMAAGLQPPDFSANPDDTVNWAVISAWRGIAGDALDGSGLGFQIEDNWQATMGAPADSSWVPYQEPCRSVDVRYHGGVVMLALFAWEHSFSGSVYNFNFGTPSPAGSLTTKAFGLLNPPESWRMNTDPLFVGSNIPTGLALWYGKKATPGASGDAQWVGTALGPDEGHASVYGHQAAFRPKLAANYPTSTTFALTVADLPVGTNAIAVRMSDGSTDTVSVSIPVSTWQVPMAYSPANVLVAGHRPVDSVVAVGWERGTLQGLTTPTVSTWACGIKSIPAEGTGLIAAVAGRQVTGLRANGATVTVRCDTATPTQPTVTYPDATSFLATFDALPLGSSVVIESGSTLTVQAPRFDYAVAGNRLSGSCTADAAITVNGTAATKPTATTWQYEVAGLDPGELQVATVSDGTNAITLDVQGVHAADATGSVALRGPVSITATASARLDLPLTIRLDSQGNGTATVSGTRRENVSVTVRTA